MSEAHFSPHEIGLLTVIERRGSVRTPCKVDERNDPANIERLTMLRRLVLRGLLLEAELANETAELEFTMTDAGHAALAALDKARPAHAAGQV